MGTQITLDRLGEFKALENGCIASIETATASKAYAIGDRFYLAGKLCTATADIAQGGTIELDTNCKLDVLGDDVAVLERTVDNDNLYHKILGAYEVNRKERTSSTRPAVIERNMFIGNGGSGSSNYYDFMLATDNTSVAIYGSSKTSAQVANDLASRPQLFIPTSLLLNNLNQGFGFFIKDNITSNSGDLNVVLFFGNSDGESVTDITYSTSYNLNTRPFNFLNPSYQNLLTKSHFTIAVRTTNSFTGSVELGLYPFRTTQTPYVPAANLFNTELSGTASQAYAVNDLVYVWATLYKVTAPIASGAAFTVGTNIQATTLGAEITALLNA